MSIEKGWRQTYDLLVRGRRQHLRLQPPSLRKVERLPECFWILTSHVPAQALHIGPGLPQSKQSCSQNPGPLAQADRWWLKGGVTFH